MKFDNLSSLYYLIRLASCLREPLNTCFLAEARAAPNPPRRPIPAAVARNTPAFTSYGTYGLEKLFTRSLDGG